MSQNFWLYLPGAVAFLDDISRSLRSGNNVVLCLPQYPPGSLRTVLIKQFLEETHRTWYVLETSELNSYSPIEYLIRRFLGEHASSTQRRVEDLVKSERFRDLYFWVTFSSAQEWSKWKAFLVEYQHSCQTIPNYCRSLFLFELVGELATSPPPSNAGVMIHHWRDFLDLLDMEIYVSLLFQEVNLPSLKKRVLRSVLSELAQFDPHLVDFFRQTATFDEILAPSEKLLQFAIQRQWKALAIPSEDETRRWATGMVNVMNSEKKVHSAALVMEGNEREILSRIWSGELKILFPFIEEQRRLLVSKYRSVLQLPHQTPSREITQFEDLELSHIREQLQNIVGISPDTRTKIRQLCEIRNRLAHFQPLTPQQVGWLEDLEFESSGA